MKAAGTQVASLAPPDSRPMVGRFPRPDWLLEGSDESRWLFRQDVPGYAQSHYTVTWEFCSISSIVSATRRQYWQDVAQLAVIVFGTSSRTKNARVTSIINFARLIRSFAMWACGERRCSSISDLNDDDVRAYEEYVGKLRLVQSSVEQRLAVLKVLWQLRSELGESIGVQAYRWRGELNKVAKRLGCPDGRTPTLAPEPFFTLLNHSLMLIEKGEEWVSLAEQYVSVRSAFKKPGYRMRRVGDVSAGEVIRMARDVYGACVVLIFSLLGSRKHEIAFLQADDARRFLQEEDAELNGVVTKSSNGSGGTRTVRPVIPELKKAIGFVARLTGIDLANGSGPLFRPIMLDLALQSRATTIALDTGQIYRLIERVVASAGVAMVVRPHMFRRAFSMVYVWRYELGDLAHLSRFLYHNDLRHTLAYTQGDDIKVFIADAERDLARSIMERALTGRERFGGGFGTLLEKIGRRLRATTTILRPDQVDRWLEPRLAAGQFSIRPAPHGYCVLLGDRGGRGRCSTDWRSPDYANRTDEHCAACGNFLLTSRSADYWRARYDAHANVATLTSLEILKRVALEAMAAAKRMLDSIGGFS